MNDTVGSEGISLPYEWTVRLGDQYPGKRVPVLVAAFVGGSMGVVLLQAWWAFFLGFGAVILSAAELFLPQYFCIDNDGAHVRMGVSRSTLAWADVKRAMLDEDILHLSPLTKPSRLDAFRGVRLRFSGNQERLLVKIAELLDEHGCVVDRRSDPGGTGSADREALERDHQEGS